MEEVPISSYPAPSGFFSRKGLLLTPSTPRLLDLPHGKPITRARSHHFRELTEPGFLPFRVQPSWDILRSCRGFPRLASRNRYHPVVTVHVIGWEIPASARRS
jgi:hypothetical protein